MAMPDFPTGAEKGFTQRRKVKEGAKKVCCAADSEIEPYRQNDPLFQSDTASPSAQDLRAFLHFAPLREP
ncbi:MAG: hypothetical protein WBL74_04480, partial [Novosphingobium sp.]|uniref:hypothetical protein n=1 Tax=Novosphingobium sp. TaxID=1874826 RepID=UPI003C7EAD01